MNNKNNMSNMDSNLIKQSHFEQAQKRIKLIKNFYLRLGVYSAVNAMLLIVYLLDPYVANNFWTPTCFFTTVVAGLLVLANAINLYGGKYIVSKKWEARKLNEYINKDSQPTVKYE